MCRPQGFVFDIDNIKLIFKSERWMLILMGQVYMSIMLMSCISISTSRAISNKNAPSRFRLLIDSFTEPKVRFGHLLNLGVSWSLDVKIYYKLWEFHFVQMSNSDLYLLLSSAEFRFQHYWPKRMRLVPTLWTTLNLVKASPSEFVDPYCPWVLSKIC